MTAQLMFKLPVRFKTQGEWIIASCPYLDVLSQGRTREQALSNIREAVSLFLESCMERGTIDEVLRDCGFTEIHAIDAMEDAKGDDDGDAIEVPFELIAHDANSAHRLAHPC